MTSDIANILYVCKKKVHIYMYKKCVTYRSYNRNDLHRYVAARADTQPGGRDKSGKYRNIDDLAHRVEVSSNRNGGNGVGSETKQPCSVGPSECKELRLEREGGGAAECYSLLGFMLTDRKEPQVKTFRVHREKVRMRFSFFRDKEHTIHNFIFGTCFVSL